MALERRIAYLWVPHFGTAVARRADGIPEGRPLILLDDDGRVLAADAAATRAGVVLGLPERHAAARCPEAILKPAARFPVWEAQERFLDRVKLHAGRWQPDGLGRVYLDMTGLESPGGRSARTARRPGLPGGAGTGRAGVTGGVDPGMLSWCQAVAGAVRVLDLRPALGVTDSKFGAYVAGQVAWQNAALLLSSAAQRAFLASQPVTTLPLDSDVLTQLRHLGIRTLGQYARLPVAGVLSRFGSSGRTAQRWAQGLDDRPVVPPWEAPQVSTRAEFETPLADRERLLMVLMHRAGKLLSSLAGRLQAASRVTLEITRADGRVVPVSHAFPLPTAAAEPVRLAIGAALGRVAWEGQGATEITLTLAGITDAPGEQLALFDVEENSRSRLGVLLDRLATRFGPEAFQLATLTDPDNPLPERRAGLSRWR
jgi:nucleotidyltransferase/DNA polymerase involved in DNA repair